MHINEYGVIKKLFALPKKHETAVLIIFQAKIRNLIEPLEIDVHY